MANRKYLKTAIFQILGIIAVFGVVFFSYRTHLAFRESMIAQTTQHLLAIAKTTARSVADTISLPSGILQKVARDTLLQRKVFGILDGSENKTSYSPLEVFLMVHGKNVNTIFLLDHEGNIVQSHGIIKNNSSENNKNALDRQGVALVLKEKKANVGSAFFNSKGDLTFAISEPVFNNKELLGVTQRVISLNGLSRKLLEPALMQGQTRAWMFDDRYVIVSHPQKEFVGMSIMDIIAKQHQEKGEHFHPNELQVHLTRSHGYFYKVRDEDEGSGIFVSSTSGENELVAYKGIKVLDRQWGLVVTLPYNSIAGPISEHARKVSGMAVFFVLLFLAGGTHLLNSKRRAAELEAEAKYLKPLAASAEALREGEKRFRDLVENSLVGILIVQDGLVVYQNPEQERLFGNLPGQFQLSKFQNFHPDDAAKFHDFFQRVLTGKELVPDLEVRFYPLEPSQKTLSELRWALCRARLIHFEGRNAVLVNMVDITRTKELEHLVMVKQKMVSLGHVAAGIAHEIRNPLSGINIHLSTLQRIFSRMDGLDQDSQVKIEKILTQLQSASSRIEMVIRKVMDFAKPGQPKLISADINESLLKAMDLSGVTLSKSGIVLQQVLYPDLPRCKADSHLIEQVVLNLITNAAQAMGSITQNKKIIVSSHLVNGQVTVKVSDSGPGVPENNQLKIFDPFFTTKNDSSGIGLSLSHRIISDHGGTLTVGNSKLGGAEFTIELPVIRNGN